ncbi:MAG: hypothetical protein Q7N50_02310 [Armatimonadota bacterium]|nr:hypothetical protein [Armatimonadota bacterium]
MTKHLFVALLVAAVLIFVAAPISATNIYGEYDQLDTRPHLNVRAGIFFTSGDLEDSNELYGGLEYEMPLNKLSNGTPGSLTLSADYTQISSVSGDATLVPVLLNFKRRTVARDYPLYFALGAGVYWANDPIPEMQLDDGASFAWQLMAGVEFQSGFFIEGRYLAGENPSDDGLTALSIGLHF